MLKFYYYSCLAFRIGSELICLTPLSNLCEVSTCVLFFFFLMYVSWGKQIELSQFFLLFFTELPCISHSIHTTLQQYDKFPVRYKFLPIFDFHPFSNFVKYRHPHIYFLLCCCLMLFLIVSLEDGQLFGGKTFFFFLNI